MSSEAQRTQPNVLARLRAASFRLGERIRESLKRCLPTESQHLFALTIVVGLVCGLLAVAFHLAIQAFEHLLIGRALAMKGWQGAVWTILTPALGGLVAGALLTYVVPGARGSGIPQVKQAFALGGGRVPLREAVGKFIIGALQIGSGASLGREGPTVQICAGAASALARITWLPPAQLRRLTPVGVAAGIAAAFNAPIAAVTFTIEEIVGGLDQTVLSGVVIAAALAAVIERSILGVHPVIEVAQSYGLDHPSSLLFYAVLGVLAAAGSVVFTDGLLNLRMWFRNLKSIPNWAQPGVGGLVTGLMALGALRLLGTGGIAGGGYATLGDALAGNLGLQVLLGLWLLKTIATVFSYASGGAGGILAPSLFMGAMLGGAVGFLDVTALGHEHHELGAFALVGMGAVFAGVNRAPITSVLIIFEMTGGYGLVLPLMLANMTSYLLAKHWRPEPIFEALLAQDGVHLSQETKRSHPLESLTVDAAMTRQPVVAKDTLTVAQVLELMGASSFALLPIVSETGRLEGAVRTARLKAAAAERADLPIKQLLEPAHTVREGTSLVRAVVQLNDCGIRQLFVIGEGLGAPLLGVLAMSDVVKAHARAPTGTGRAPRVALEQRVSLGSLAIEARRVSANTKVDSLLDTPGWGTDHVSVLEAHEPFHVVLPEFVRDVIGDEQLQALLLAADLARPALSLPRGATFDAAVGALVASDAAALVISDDQGQPAGVVTRQAIGEALLDWYAEQLKRVTERNPTGTGSFGVVSG